MLRRCQGQLQHHPSGAVKAQKIFTAALTLNGLGLLALLCHVIVWLKKKKVFVWGNEGNMENRKCVLSRSCLSCYCKRVSNITCTHAGFGLIFAPSSFSSCSASRKSLTQDADLGDVKLCGRHTPLDRSKRTDMSKTTNLLHKQETTKRLGRKWWEGLRRASKRSYCLGLGSPRLSFYISTQGGMGKY